MREELKYREQEYFNSTDTYLYDNNLGGLIESKAIKENGFWWLSNRYKATTVKCIKINTTT